MERLDSEYDEYVASYLSNVNIDTLCELFDNICYDRGELIKSLLEHRSQVSDWATVLREYYA